MKKFSLHSSLKLLNKAVAKERLIWKELGLDSDQPDASDPAALKINRIQINRPRRLFVTVIALSDAIRIPTETNNHQASGMRSCSASSLYELHDFCHFCRRAPKKSTISSNDQKKINHVFRQICPWIRKTDTEICGIRPGKIKIK